jgi:hypothetical protein
MGQQNEEQQFCSSQWSNSFEKLSRKKLKAAEAVEKKFFEDIFCDLKFFLVTLIIIAFGKWTPIHKEIRDNGDCWGATEIEKKSL